ncbi:MAG TPA: hypothetical protein VN030_11855 [Cellvibrio sp.]|nr:hypothetical protein [Cellvibrio sp.]
MESLDKAIEAAYQAEISNLYKAFSEGMLAAKDNELMIKGAKERFKVGLERAAHIHNTALSLIK